MRPKCSAVFGFCASWNSASSFHLIALFGQGMQKCRIPHSVTHLPLTVGVNTPLPCKLTYVYHVVCVRKAFCRVWISANTRQTRSTLQEWPCAKTLAVVFKACRNNLKCLFSKHLLCTRSLCTVWCWLLIMQCLITFYIWCSARCLLLVKATWLASKLALIVE